MAQVEQEPKRCADVQVALVNGLRIVLFPVGSDAGLGAQPRPPLSFFLGGADLPSGFLLLPAGRAALAEEPVEELA